MSRHTHTTTTFDVRTDTRQALADRVTELESQLDRLARVAEAHSSRLEQIETTLDTAAAKGS